MNFSSIGRVWSRIIRRFPWGQKRLVCSKRFSSAMDFADTKAAYTNLSDRELRRSLLVLRLSSVDAFVDHSLKLMTLGERLLPASWYDNLMKQTFYGQFVAGKTDRELLHTAERFFASGIRSIPQLAIEEELTDEEVLAAEFRGYSEEHLDNHLPLLEECIGIGEKLAEAGGRNDYMNTKLAIKLSAIVHPILLTRLSSAISCDGQLPRVTAVELHAMMEKSALGEGYASAYSRALERLDKLLKQIHSKKLTVLIDAEYTYMQPAIRAIVLYIQSKYNKHRPVVYNTEQAYLKKAIDINKKNLEIAELSGFCYATKVVRGAYMDSERALAKRIQKPDPIHDTYQDTSSSYDRIVNNLLERVVMAEVGLMVATHNEKSVMLAVERMKELSIDRDAGTVSFTQLLGLCDHITFTLGREKYLTYKLLHYGELKHTLAFLCRRAQENRSATKGFRREKELILKELTRRRIAGKQSSSN